jgi:hypothetical protein
MFMRMRANFFIPNILRFIETSENNKADFATAKSALLKIRKLDPSDVTH